MFQFAKEQRYSLDAGDSTLQRRPQRVNMRLHSFTRANGTLDGKTTKNASQTLTQLPPKGPTYPKDQ